LGALKAPEGGLGGLAPVRKAEAKVPAPARAAVGGAAPNPDAVAAKKEAKKAKSAAGAKHVEMF
jgi:hypothetical protein